MNDINTNKKLTPKRVIVIYDDKATGKGEYYSMASNYYLESRDIQNVDGKYTMSAPVPLANNVLKSIAMSYIKKNPFSMDFGGLLAEHLLLGSSVPGKTVVMWYRKPMERVLNFSASLKIKGSCSVHIPCILYLVINDKLYMYALMSGQRPDIKTKLYKAPFFNIYDDGNVCLGSAKIGSQRAKTYEKEAERFERAFYMAEQTHTNIISTKSTLNNVWNKQIKTKAAFPSKTELIQHKKYKTLGDLLNNLIGINSYNNEQDNIQNIDEDDEEGFTEEENEINITV